MIFCTIHGHRDAGKIFGKIECNRGSLKHLNIYGNTILDATNITGKLEVHGHLYAKNGMVNNSYVFGVITLKNEKFLGDVDFHGKLKSDNSRFSGKFIVVGNADIDKSHVNKKFTIYGRLDADDSVFKGPVNIHSHYSKIDDSKVIGRIDIAAKYRKPMLKLKGSTKVLGNIIFSKKRGIVCKSEHSVILGKVVNGELADC